LDAESYRKCFGYGRSQRVAWRRYYLGFLSNHWTHTLSVYGPSDLSFKKGIYPDPKPISEEDIDNKIIKAFVESTKRAEKAGCA